MKLPKRLDFNELYKERAEIMPFKEVDVINTYYQVVVGAYGVCLPKVVNMETLDGLTLVDGKASTIYDEKLAKQIAEKTSGKLLTVEERFTRLAKEVGK